MASHYKPGTKKFLLENFLQSNKEIDLNSGTTIRINKYEIEERLTSYKLLLTVTIDNSMAAASPRVDPQPRPPLGGPPIDVTLRSKELNKMFDPR